MKYGALYISRFLQNLVQSTAFFYYLTRIDEFICSFFFFLQISHVIFHALFGHVPKLWIWFQIKYKWRQEMKFFNIKGNRTVKVFAINLRRNLSKCDEFDKYWILQISKYLFSDLKKKNNLRYTKSNKIPMFNLKYQIIQLQLDELLQCTIENKNTFDKKRNALRVHPTTLLHFRFIYIEYNI